MGNASLQVDRQTRVNVSQTFRLPLVYLDVDADEVPTLAWPKSKQHISMYRFNLCGRGIIGTKRSL